MQTLTAADMQQQLRALTDTFTLDDKRTTHVAKFDSQSDLGRFSQDLQRASPLATDTADWGRGYSAQDDARRLLGQRVNHKIAKVIRETMSKVSAACTMQDGYAMSPFGAYPVVPAAIAGDPLSMKRREAQPDASAPLRFWFPMTTTWSIDDETYARVMAYAASMAITLSEARPVEVMTYSFLPVDKNCFDKLPTSIRSKRGKRGPRHQAALIITTPVRTDCMDADAIAAWCSCKLGRTTHMLITRCLATGYDGGWGWGQAPVSDEVNGAIRRHLQVADTDIFIPSAIRKDYIPLLRQQILEQAEASGVDIDIETLNHAMPEEA